MIIDNFSPERRNRKRWSIFLVLSIVISIIYSNNDEDRPVRVLVSAKAQQVASVRRLESSSYTSDVGDQYSDSKLDLADSRISSSQGKQNYKQVQDERNTGKTSNVPSHHPRPPAIINNSSATTRMTIETAVFLDQALSSRYASMSQGLADLNKLVLTIMNQVKYMFQYSSLSKPIDIKLVLIESVKESERRGSMRYIPSPEMGDIDLYLTNFCQWQQTRLETNKEQLWWDHAILLSGLDLYKTTSSGNQSGVLGLSWVGGMCKGNYSCTVGEAIHLESAFVIAHEIGHSLGMMHDGNKNNCDPNKYIMSDKTGAGKINWSRCSNNYLNDSLKRNQLVCLYQNQTVSGSTDPMYELSKLKPPGQVYSLNDQCRLAYGSNYSPFISHDAPYNNVCQELWCVSGSWARPVHPALEGSSCNRSQESSRFNCREGKCVSNM